MLLYCFIYCHYLFKIQGDEGFRHIGVKCITIKHCVIPYDMPSYLHKSVTKQLVKDVLDQNVASSPKIIAFLITMINFKEERICLNRKCT